MSVEFKFKPRIVLAASIAANIFLIAFILGRLTAFDHAPLPMGFAGGDRMHGPFPGAVGLGQPMPRFFGPQEVMTPDEIKVHEERMRQDFEKMALLRKEFAADLADHAVNKDEVLKHFAAMEVIMDAVKKEIQETAATKISTMSDTERRAFAQELLKDSDAMSHAPAR